MVKVRVISMFHDKTDYSRVFEVGQVVNFDDENRVRSIVEHGLGEIVDEKGSDKLTSKKSSNTIEDVKRSYQKNDIKPSKKT